MIEMKETGSTSLEERLTRLHTAPIIAAVGNRDAFQTALASPAQAIYLLFGTPLSLPGLIRDARREGKLCMINLDFVEGLARDRHAIEYLASHGAEGIVSTKADVLRTVKALGMVSVLRTFIIDSAALVATLKVVTPFAPDAVEILPAIAAPKVLARFRPLHPGLHIIGGGLVGSVREIESLFGEGVNSVSVSDARLWVI